MKMDSLAHILNLIQHQALPINSISLAALFSLSVLLVLINRSTSFSAKKKTSLRGPPSPSFIFGVIPQLRLSTDPKLVYAQWAKAYGPVYRIPTILGGENIIVADPKAAAHIFAKDTYVYVKTPGLRKMIEGLIGRGLLWAEGGSHRRQRKALNPAFGIGAVKEMTGAFYDCAFRLKSAWEKMLDNEEHGSSVEIEMHGWVTKLVLDGIGLTAFGHHFHSLEGEHTVIEDAIAEFNSSTPSKLTLLLYIASSFVPLLRRVPTQRQRLFRNMSDATRDILDGLMEQRKRVYGVGEGKDQDGGRGRSVIELLIDQEITADADPAAVEERKEEIIAQMKTVLIAGSDPPGLLMVWVLIELARRPDIQSRLREEVIQVLGTFGDREATYDELQKAFPYLDAVISEALRLHPPTGETPRTAAEDDILPLSQPILDAAGNMTDTIFIPKGTHVDVPNRYLNVDEAVWGVDALVFDPERWIRPATEGAHRPRSWSFGEGPRACIGKGLALLQMKIVLSVLVREFIFELPQGPDTPLGVHFSLIPRPKVDCVEGAKVPFIVSRAR